MKGNGTGTVTSEPDRSLLDELRESTQSIHQRLHGHSGLRRLQAAALTRDEYAALLARLYGHYKPLAPLIGSIAERVRLMECDLAALGVSGLEVCRLQAGLSGVLVTESNLLGAEYVSEGSALGGQLLAQGARGLLGPDPANGYRFFRGAGSGTARRWKTFAARLESAPQRGLNRAEIISGARHTFLAFERWMAE